MKIEVDHIVRWRGKLWLVMSLLPGDQADLWNVNEDATAKLGELEYIGEDTLTTMSSVLPKPFSIHPASPANRKRDSITTGALISEEVKKLREDGRPAAAQARPATGRKSVLDEDLPEPKAKGERKGTW